MHSSAPLSLLFCVVTLGCAPGTQPPRGGVSVATVTVPPAPPSPRAEPLRQAIEPTLDVDFDHAIRLVGYRVVPAEVAANDEVVLTLSWKRYAAIEPDWLFFVHVKSGLATIFSDPNRVPAAGCALGATCEYEIRFRAPDDFTRLDVLAGVWRGADRMAITRGHADEDRRAIVGSIARRAR